MYDFVGDNILFVLTLIGAVISFLASFVGLTSKKKPILILSVLAVLGFTVGLAYQYYDYAEGQISKAARQARDNVIEEINLTVRSTKVTVDSIAELLKTTTLQEVATELVTIRTSGNIQFEETAAFAKGSPDMWHNFSDWLTTAVKPSVSPSLSLTFNAHHQYDSGLLLAYLLTSGATRNSLKDIIKTHSRWSTFPADAIYLKAFASNTAHLHWILFYDEKTHRLEAYADAQTFIQELMVYHRLKQHGKINGLLNARGSNTIAKLRKSFPSIQQPVFRTNSPAELVKSMIEKELAVTVTSADKKPYVVKLASMIQLAATKN